MYFFLIFHRNKFYSPCKLSPKETICMIQQTLFSGENIAIDFSPGMLRVDNAKSGQKPFFVVGQVP